MNTKLGKRKLTAAMAMMAGAAALAACASTGQIYGMSSGQQIAMSGASEVPPVSTPASGSGTVTINADRSVSARISATGMPATASHIHEGATGSNGPVIVPFTKTGDNTFVAPEGAKLTESQYASYKAGRLYVNVHSAAHPGGEIRAQLKGG